MPRERQKRIIITSVRLPLEAMAATMLMTPDMLEERFKDARGAWPFSEIWGERYCAMTAGDYVGQQRGSATNALGKGNIHFQRAKYVGSSRKATPEDLISSLRAHRSYVVVDLRNFPEILLVDIPSEDLIGAAEAGALTVNGWSGKAFDKWLHGRYAVRRVVVSPNQFARARGPHVAVSRRALEGRENPASGKGQEGDDDQIPGKKAV